MVRKIISCNKLPEILEIHKCLEYSYFCDITQIDVLPKDDRSCGEALVLWQDNAVVNSLRYVSIRLEASDDKMLD